MTTGVKGSVIKLTGNFMPTTTPREGRNSTNPHQNIFVIALRAPIFEEELKSHASSLESIQTHPKFIKMIQTNSEGKYQFDLPIGLEVTIVAWIKNKPYLNSYIGTGSWSFVKIPDSGYINFDIYDNMDACC